MSFLSSITGSLANEEIFGAHREAIASSITNWENLGASFSRSDNANQNALLETVYRYFGDRAEAALDLKSTAFQAPVLEAIPFPDAPYTSKATAKDAVLRRKGLDARLAYFAALSSEIENSHSWTPETFGQIAASTSEAYNWLSQREITEALNSEECLAIAQVSGRLSSRMTEFCSREKLTLPGAREDLSSVLAKQFEDSLQEWLRITSQRRPELFRKVSLGTSLENMTVQVGNPKEGSDLE